MKTLLLTLSFLLFAFTTSAEPVLDTNGDSLVPGEQYFIYPVIWGATGGGVRPGKAGNSAYRTAVVKSFSEVDYGKALKFQSLVKSCFVPTDSKLSIEFAETPKGVESANWIAVKDLGETWSVGIGGTKDHEGYETLSGLFKISKAGLGYKFSFVPSLSNTVPGDIGTYIDDEGIWRLVLTNGQAYEFVFIKASNKSS